MNKYIVAIAVLMVISFSAPDIAGAASCCGGGSASSLVLPKFSKTMIDVSLDVEKYHGYWNQDGTHVSDPPGSDLRQYRLNLGVAKRLSDNWQASVIAPYVFNDNEYSGISSKTSGVGDITVNLWYEAFEKVMCIWKVRQWKDLIPAAYFGTSLTIPTGISPYDSVGQSFEVTGRGFYRLDAVALFDKTIYPWNMSLLVVYGKHLERSVNREYGTFVEPYKKKLGDRRLVTISGGYTHFLPSVKSLTGTVAYSDLKEEKGEVDGHSDPATGIRKKSISLTAALASSDRSWIFKFSYSHAFQKDGWGENFPTTDIYTTGVTYVFR